jgi:hypothetical protein
MTLQDIYDLLADGEGSQLPIFSDGLSVDEQPKVNRYIQAGLDALYSRFPLKAKQLTIVMREEINEYPLVVGSPYMDNGLVPYTGDLLKVTSVTNEACCELYINNNDQCGGVFLPEYNLLVIPNPVDGDALFVNYLDKHPSVIGQQANFELELPVGLITALVCYVSYRLMSGSADQLIMGKSQMLLSQYEMICQQQDMYGMVNRDWGTPSDSFAIGGWV